MSKYTGECTPCEAKLETNEVKEVIAFLQDHNDDNEAASHGKGQS